MSNLTKEPRPGETEKKQVPLQKKEAQPPLLPKGSQLISFGERVTFTFVHGNDVGSIHFDRMRGEIFYKGHNIRYLFLEEPQHQMLEKMRLVLRGDPRGNHFADPYEKALDKIILEKSKANKIE